MPLIKHGGSTGNPPPHGDGQSWNDQGHCLRFRMETALEAHCSWYSSASRWLCNRLHATR
eukprot:6858875-Pyramimonas_sp.AAC.1